MVLVLGAAGMVLAAALVLGAAPARADEAAVNGSAGNAEARRQFADGELRFRRGDYDGAAAAFRAAIAADPSLPGPYRNLGLTYRALDRCAEALPLYQRYLALKPDSRFGERVRGEIALCHARLIAPALPTLLHVAANMIGGECTDEAMVAVDGLVRGATPLTLPLTAGVHRLELTRRGFESAALTVEVPAGERRDVEVTLRKLQSGP